MPGKNSKKMIGACVVTAALLCAPSALKAEVALYLCGRCYSERQPSGTR